jgi:N-carbamoylputrescine amidase
MTNTPLRVALLQEHDHGSVEANLAAIEAGLREAAAQRVQLVLLQELHNGPYFLPARKRR